jgi:hypothetical protein
MIYHTSASIINKEAAHLCELLGQKLAQGEIRYFLGYQVAVLQFSSETLSVMFREEMLDLHWGIPDGCGGAPYGYTVKTEVEAYNSCLKGVVGQQLQCISVLGYRVLDVRNPHTWDIGGISFSFNVGELRIVDTGDETGVECGEYLSPGEMVTPICA